MCVCPTTTCNDVVRYTPEMTNTMPTSYPATYRCHSFILHPLSTIRPPPGTYRRGVFGGVSHPPSKTPRHIRLDGGRLHMYG